MRLRLGFFLCCALVLSLAGGAAAGDSAKKPAKKPTFEGVTGYGPLRWDMGLAAAAKALNDAGIPTRIEELRGYFPPKLEHTTERILMFDPARDWAGEARFTKEERLSTLRVAAFGRLAKDVDAALDRLREKYGPPAETKESVKRREWIWSNATTRLTLSASRGDADTDTWYVSEAWGRVAPP